MISRQVHQNVARGCCRVSYSTVKVRLKKLWGSEYFNLLITVMGVRHNKVKNTHMYLGRLCTQHIVI